MAAVGTSSRSLAAAIPDPVVPHALNGNFVESSLILSILLPLSGKYWNFFAEILNLGGL